MRAQREVGGSFDLRGQRTVRFVCPICKGGLSKSAHTLDCTACGMTFSQPGDHYINFLPDGLFDDSACGWQERQLTMEAWYQDLLADPKKAEWVLMHDHEPYAEFLHSLSGTVLDLGGGIGAVRMFLAPEVEYLVIDPSLAWLGDGWREILARLAERSRGGTADHASHDSTFVRGVAEHLPFADQSFDAVLAFWTLNHVADPAAVFREVHRVLRSGGQFLLVLEDMEPSWLDLARRLLGRFRPARPPAPYPPSWKGRETLAEKLRLRRIGEHWPIQKDHLRISDADIQCWSKRRFSIRRREWRGDFLSYRLQAMTPRSS